MPYHSTSSLLWYNNTVFTCYRMTNNHTMITAPATMTTALSDITHIDHKHARALERLNITTIHDLLYHFPSRYDDFSTIYKINEIGRDMAVTIAGIVQRVTSTRSFKKRMTITTATITDNTGSVRLVWFNDRFVGNNLKDGMAIRVSGTVSADFDGILLTNPVFERAARPPVNTARLVPIYPETANITSRWLRWKIDEQLRTITTIPDIIPEDIRTRLNLPDRATALRYIHFPRTQDHAELAQKYFAFEEMLLVQLQALRIKHRWHSEKAPCITNAATVARTFTQTLPFTLTNAQKRAITAITKDLTTNQPMNRLINGDVGSGKTVIAATAAYVAATAGYQVAILAPTEVLARQHYTSIRTMFANTTLSCALMTGTYKFFGNKKVTRPTILKHLKNGTAQIIIGTHALISDDVHFHNLAIVVIDEQHRFGVAQRSAMQRKTCTLDDGSTQTIPHFLTMTATPIPRSLALAFFGDVDLSVLDEMPHGRKPIKTTVVGSMERTSTYTFIRQQLTKGRQAYVILPLVEASGKESLAHVKAATQEAQELQENVFADFTVGLIHGRMKAQEKDTIMQRFNDGAINVLVATAVVEVGVDVPNATVMIIEGAERFGLSQLHQFRGRIGRGTHQSYCFLFTSKTVDPPPERLRILAHNTSGFAIAEEDMKLRGPGQFFGTRQSGLPDIAMANITNIRLIEHAKTAAQEILDHDTDLTTHPILKEALTRFEQTIHME